MDSRIEKLAEVLVTYSCHVQKGEKVYIHYIGKDTTDLARQLVKEVYKAGGVPFVHLTADPVFHLSKRHLLFVCACVLLLRAQKSMGDSHALPAYRHRKVRQVHCQQ